MASCLWIDSGKPIINIQRFYYICHLALYLQVLHLNIFAVMLYGNVYICAACGTCLAILHANRKVGIIHLKFPLIYDCKSVVSIFCWWWYCRYSFTSQLTTSPYNTHQPYNRNEYMQIMLASLCFLYESSADSDLRIECVCLCAVFFCYLHAMQRMKDRQPEPDNYQNRWSPDNATNKTTSVCVCLSVRYGTWCIITVSVAWRTQRSTPQPTQLKTVMAFFLFNHSIPHRKRKLACNHMNIAHTNTRNSCVSEMYTRNELYGREPVNGICLWCVQLHQIIIKYI